MEPTTDQKLTLIEALIEARDLGFTAVLYPFGWQTLADIYPRKLPVNPHWQLVTIDGTSYVRNTRNHSLRYMLRLA